jgi:hypothetical protein
MLRICAVIAAAAAVVAPGSVVAATKKQQPSPVVERSAAGTVIQPTETIIHDQYGHTTVIVVPRRSYLDTGTEVSPGDRKFRDYVFPAGGDPGRASRWFIGPDATGAVGYSLPGPNFMIPGFSPNSPY